MLRGVTITMEKDNTGEKSRAKTKTRTRAKETFADKEEKKTADLLEKYEVRIQPNWGVEALFGNSILTPEYAVKLTSKLAGGQSRTYTRDDFNENSLPIKRELRRIGGIRPDDFGILNQYVDYLIEQGEVTQVPSLMSFFNTNVSEDNAKELFDLTVCKIIEDRESFPRLSSQGFYAEQHSGLQLDTQEYIDRFKLDSPMLNDEGRIIGDEEGTVAFGITSKTLAKLLGTPSHRTSHFRDVVYTWLGYEYLIPIFESDRNNGMQIKTGGSGTKRFFILRIQNFAAHKAKNRAEMRYPANV
jgi:hypothetical protein